MSSLLWHLGLPLAAVALPVGGFLLFTPWGGAALALLATSKPARLAALVLAGLAGLALAIARAFSAGKASERAKQQAADQKAVDTIRAAQREVDGLTDAEVDKRLQPWVKR